MVIGRVDLLALTSGKMVRVAIGRVARRARTVGKMARATTDRAMARPALMVGKMVPKGDRVAIGRAARRDPTSARMVRKEVRAGVTGPAMVLPGRMVGKMARRVAQPIALGVTRVRLARRGNDPAATGLDPA